MCVCCVCVCVHVCKLCVRTRVHVRMLCVSVCMCVCARVHVYVCVRVPVCTRRSTVWMPNDIVCQLARAAHLVWDGVSFVNHGCAHRVGWLESVWGFSCEEHWHCTCTLSLPAARYFWELKLMFFHFYSEGVHPLGHLQPSNYRIAMALLRPFPF